MNITTRTFAIVALLSAGLAQENVSAMNFKKFLEQAGNQETIKKLSEEIGQGAVEVLKKQQKMIQKIHDAETRVLNNPNISDERKQKEIDRRESLENAIKSMTEASVQSLSDTFKSIKLILLQRIESQRSEQLVAEFKEDMQTYLYEQSEERRWRIINYFENYFEGFATMAAQYGIEFNRDLILSVEEFKNNPTPATFEDLFSKYIKWELDNQPAPEGIDDFRI